MRPARWARVSASRFGRLVDQTAAGAPAGTTISVRRLFQEQPARLKFVRSPAAETSQIAGVVSHYALAYPEVAFSLNVDGRETFTTSGSGDRREAAAGVYGAAVAAALIEVHEADETSALEALVAPPALSRANRNYVTLFINRRWVRSRSLSYAVEQAFSGLLQTGRFPDRRPRPAPTAGRDRRQRPPGEGGGAAAQ